MKERPIMPSIVLKPKNIPYFIFYATLFLIPLVESSLGTTCNHCTQCSGKPEVLGCDVRNENNIMETNSSIHWKGFRPIALRIHSLLKTNPETGALMTVVMTRWRLPRGALATQLTGFQLNFFNVTNKEDVMYTTQAMFSEPIQQVTTQIGQVDFAVDIEKIFSLGTKLKLEVSLLPAGIGGVADVITVLPQPLKSTECVKDSETRKLAKFWQPEVHNVLLESAAAIEVSFLAAPTELCIEHFVLQLHVKDQPLTFRQILNVTGLELHHQFLSVPRGKQLMVKVMAYNPSECICEGCSCIVSVSQAFVLPIIKKPSIGATELPLLSISAPSRSLFIWLSVICTVLLLFFLLSLVAYFLYRKNEQLVKQINILHSNALTTPLVSDNYARNYSILLVSNANSNDEWSVVDHLARKIALGPHQLFYDRFDEDLFSLNTHMWILNAIRSADKIVFVHCRNDRSRRVADSFGMVYRSIPLNDDRTVHVRLHESVEVDLAEVVFSLPRDTKHLETSLNISFDLQFQYKLEQLNETPTCVSPKQEQKIEVHVESNVNSDSGMCSGNCSEDETMLCTTSSAIDATSSGIDATSSGIDATSSGIDATSSDFVSGNSCGVVTSTSTTDSPDPNSSSSLSAEACSSHHMDYINKLDAREESVDSGILS